ncbi:MAG TPA: malto-oligosyltrehalose trehalohydrolase [Pyrinomonadaceae bacterium]|nr:malto-oligosyltrehalose trehalohydrolase [Pyrinomonadaceae bacterium]
MGADFQRRLPVGAEVQAGGGTHFRMWVPRRRRVEVVLESPTGERLSAFELNEEDGGYFSAFNKDARDGTLYRFRLDGDDSYLYPDPVSRFQPAGPHGPSRVVDPSKFRWTDREWRGRPLRGQVIYELHVGTFTREGSLAAAARELPELADTGITVVELMPLADFPGRFGWGYDGVNMFAPTRLYGEPDDLRRFVDEAHRAGLAVILDVVYNHFGPDGNYLGQFSSDYVTDRYDNEWGDAINFDGENAAPVREFFVANAGYWIDEFHMDGLRLDATQQIFDASEEHILTAVGREVRRRAGGRETIIVAENEEQQAWLALPPGRGGYGLDGLWNDDFHHSAVVAVTGRNEAYYTDFAGRPQEFISAVKYGYLFQGQRFKWQRKRRGKSSLDVPPDVFVNYIQNHDQVANSATGERLHKLTSPGRFRALTALLLLAPSTPMLFQGQEFASSAPFLFFADHNEDLSRLVCKGRADFLAQFRSVATKETREQLPDPSAYETFERCKLDLSERERNRGAYDLHRDLLRLRREDAVFSAQRQRGVDGAVLGREAFVLRFLGDGGDDRLLVVNFGRDLHLDIVPEPLLAPPAESIWAILWSSEDPRYGGGGTPPVETDDNWRIPGHAAVALRPSPVGEMRDRAAGRGEETEEAETRREGLADLAEGRR